VRGAACTVALMALTAAAGEARDFAIGYVSHYPMVVHEDDALAGTGANVVEVRAPWALIEPRDGEFDFTLLDQQLEWAERNDLQLVFIMEAGPAHAAGVPWLIDRLQAQGETMVDLAGNVQRDPSLFSATYKQYLSRYLRRVTEHLASHPLNRRVYGYNNGCEWWYPLSRSYSPLDIAAFRESLRARHGTLDALNERWGTSFAAWEEVGAPRLEMRGAAELPQGSIIPAAYMVDACYCTTASTHVAVQPGETLTLEADYAATDLRAGAVSVEIAWLGDERPQPLKIDRGTEIIGEAAREGTVKVSGVGPESARRAWLLVKLLGPGRVAFHEVRCLDSEGRQLAVNPGLDPAAEGWQFIRWSAEDAESVSHGWEGPQEAWIEYAPTFELASRAEYPLAEVYDWLNFRSEAVAAFLDWMAEQIRSADPNRPVVTYLTLGFANAFEWDYTYQMAILLDAIARNSEHQAVLGMQLASGEGDYDSVTCAFDMLRRHGRPLWAIDLLDFTRGVTLGREGLTRLSLSVLQHGGSGIQYYCWWGTPHYNYPDIGLDELTRMLTETRQQAARLGEATPVADVALVMPRMPLYLPLDPPPNDWADFMGWYKLLVRAGCCPDVFTLEDLAGADLSRYPAVVIPDCAYLTEEALATLSDAAHTGTPLIASGRFAERDMTGRPIAPERRPRLAHAFGKPVGAAVLGETYRQKTPTDTPPRLVCRPGSPRLQSPEARQMTRALRKAGVSPLLQPGAAPLTAVPFVDGRNRYAFVLPDRDWSGRAMVAGAARQISATGWWGPTGER